MRTTTSRSATRSLDAYPRLQLLAEFGQGQPARGNVTQQRHGDPAIRADQQLGVVQLRVQEEPKVEFVAGRQAMRWNLIRPGREAVHLRRNDGDMLRTARRQDER